MTQEAASSSKEYNNENMPASRGSDAQTSGKAPQPGENIGVSNGNSLSTKGKINEPQTISNKYTIDIDRAEEKVKEGHAEDREGDGGQEEDKEGKMPDVPANNDKRPVSMGTIGTPSGVRKQPPPKLEINDKSFDGSASDAPPTWFRRLSKFTPASNSSSTPNTEDSKRWTELKHALRFVKPKRDQQQGAGTEAEPVSPTSQQQHEKQMLDESELQARVRASNLVTALLSGVPAALFAGSFFESDEHGSRRAPLLLSMLDIKVERFPSKHNKKFKINLEYGVGPERLRWYVVKDLRSLISLHSRLKLSFFQAANFKGYKPVRLPRFPKSTEEEHEAHDEHHHTFNDGYLSASRVKNGRTVLNNRIHQDFDQASMNLNLDLHSFDSSQQGRLSANLKNMFSKVSGIDPNDSRFDHYDVKLEAYLKKLALSLSLRPQANRLFQFFELSPLSVMLSYENGYQGKQGYLFVGSTAKAQGWRVGHLKIREFKEMVERHTNKWFLVRNSYIMYASDIHSTTVLEVFLVDSSFKVTYSGVEFTEKAKQIETNNPDQNDTDSISDNSFVNAEIIDDTEGNKAISSRMSIKLENGERQLKFYARSKYQIKLWLDSIETMQKNTIWSKTHRFNSFAPVRENCFAQWFVDARDYFWAVSSAMELAKDVIYIHDWWLSPELYMRRPANGNQEFRLDRILKRKAEQGVKIFVIVYRNVGATVPIDSLWTKHSLIDLHPNVHVLRSPNQWLQNTYFWAHHEKICIIDHTVAFLGGIDLCYGRYDTPDHVLCDDSPYDFADTSNETGDSPTEEDVQFQKFPGKDYSNPRVKDFYNLDKPYESMYDRNAVPRMPWHDVHMVTAGQTASDLSRHFVQRWNYLLRQKRPSRPTPLLTPPPEFTPEQLKHFQLTGNCEVQLLRSAGNWSLGLKETEKSIQTAYLKLIETSEHFIYIENQFFVTSCELNGVIVKNRVGDAITERIIRAHREGKKWKAVIVIPLMPGFESQVDEADGSSVRLIMQCQYASISRGESSIFAKLRKLNINPYEYIHFFSLRKWGRIGPNRKLVSEQLYIHAKILLVDDRVALIGSANINERSQRGNRDSEIAAIVRDTDTVETKMDGKPYKASRFCHSLRVRLMREHLGIDVDIIDIVERRFNKLERIAKETEVGLRFKTNNFNNKENELKSSMVELASRDVLGMPGGTAKWKQFKKENKQNDDEEDEYKIQEAFQNIDRNDGKVPSEDEGLPHELKEANQPKPQKLFYHSFNNRAREQNSGIKDNKKFSTDSRISNNKEHKADVAGMGNDHMKSKEFKQYKLNAVKSLEAWAKISMVNDLNSVFLPNVDQVLEFLHDEDEIAIERDLNPEESISTEAEILISERNEERWNLLKRIAYLQRVAGKQKLQHDEENAKRSKLGLPILPSVYSDKEFEQIFKIKEILGNDNSINNGHINSILKEEVLKFHDEKNNGHNKGSSGGIINHGPDANKDDLVFGLDNSVSDLRDYDDLSGDVPVLKLNQDGIDAVISTFSDDNTKRANKFLDPYCFDDPLDDSFFEDVWFDNALRNTKIFREVFHCQPDDQVTTWKDYKDFARLNLAFGLAQDQEMNQRAQMMKKNTPSNVSFDADNGSVHGEINSVLTQEELDKAASEQPNGELGGPPEEHHSSEDDALSPHHDDSDGPIASGTAEGEAQTTKPVFASHPRKGKSKSSTYGLRKRSPMMREKVYERETADTLLEEVQGHLVLFPVDWLYREVESGNWFYNMDRLPPIEVYD